MSERVINKYHGLEYDIYIGRGSDYGNPYSHLESTSATYKVGTREEAIEKFEEYLLSTPSLWIKLKHLKDKRLGCYCHPSPCHGHVLERYSDLIGNRTWSRRDENNYEVSSVGDKRFSAFYAILPNGNSIEHEYQVIIKGYSSIKEGKGRPPLLEMSREDTYEKYKSLWRNYLTSNPELMFELATKSIGKVITDTFATSDINQARAITEILNEYLI